MIIIPMLGKSSRFFKAGYTKPKFQLLLGNESVFSLSVRSFEKYFESEPFLFLVRSDFNSRNFVSNELNRIGIKDFRIIEVDHETRGQAESVMIGLKDYYDDLPILIFNIDTLRHKFSYPESEAIGDGFLEVFIAEGDGWSFVEPGIGSSVVRTTEKNRISNYCSNGLYFFSRAADFREAFEACQKSNHDVLGEMYIAPLYNYLIERGHDIRFHLIDASLIDHCGIPEDYERMKIRYSIVG